MVISEIVRSTLAELSTILSVSAESETLIFSPVENDPVTFCKFTNSFAVPSANTIPVAPEVTPVTKTPPLV